MVALADGRAVRVLRRPALGQGPAMEILDALRGLGEGLALRRRTLSFAWSNFAVW
jgi:hypothetical protein